MSKKKNKRRRSGRAKALVTGFILGTICSLGLGSLFIWVHYTYYADVKTEVRVVPDPECEMNRVLGKLNVPKRNLNGIY